MPVANENKWVHVRLRKSLAGELRKIAKREHRYGIQVETNLAVATYIRCSKGICIYGLFDQAKCIYVGTTSDICNRARSHRKRFGEAVRIEIFSTTTSFQLAKKIETDYIKKFKRIGQADFNIENSGKAMRIVRTRVSSLE